MEVVIELLAKGLRVVQKLQSGEVGSDTRTFSPLLTFLHGDVNHCKEDEYSPIAYLGSLFFQLFNLLLLLSLSSRNLHSVLHLSHIPSGLSY